MGEDVQVPDKSPPPLAWSMRVGTEAARFFGTDSEFRAAVQREQRIEVPSNTFVPFSVMDFLGHLSDRGVETAGRRANDVDALVARMAANGILLDAGSDSRKPLFGRCYVLGSGITGHQSRGVLWLSPVIGPELIIAVMSPNIAHITGTTPEGDVHGGSGLLIDSNHILTAAHVVNDMKLDETVHFSGEYEATIKDVVVINLDRDVALISVDLPSPVAESRVAGLAFRDPQWSDQVTILGYPPVPTTVAAHLTVQTGEIVNPGVETSSSGEWFLYSAVARPGNSGGPIIGADGRVLGLVTREFSAESEKVASPFFAGVPTSSIVDALEPGSLDGVLPVEDWT